MGLIDDMTELTRYMFDRATNGQLDLNSAAEQIRNNANTRTVRDTLLSITGFSACDTRAISEYIVDKLMDTSPDSKRDSIERKVRIWMKNDTLSMSKQSAIQLGFALGLSVSKTNELLTKVCEEGFHWRNPEEIVYIYGLMNGLKYQETCALYDYMAKEGILRKLDEEKPTVYTDQVRTKIQNITEDSELEEFLRTSQRELGALHNTAYVLFTGFLELLELPVMDDMLPDVKQLSIRDIMTTYLHNDFIPRLRRSKKDTKESEKLVMSALQRGIRQSWPDETMLSKMVHRETDVTRKVLILLFLATDGGESSYGNDYIDDKTPDETFMDMYERMNSMLGDCGFARLDPRVPFDWMILYCMCADDSIFIDERVRQFLSEIFPETDSSERPADGTDDRK